MPRPPAAARGSGVSTVPVTSIAAEPSRESREAPWPSASGVPSLARIGARSPRVSRRPTRSPLSRPGKVRCGAQAIFSSSKGISITPSTSPKISVRIPDLHLDDVVVGAARVARVDRVRGRGGLGLLVGGGELLDRELLLGRVGELLVHRREVLVGPGVEEAVGRVLLGRAGRHHSADDERDQRHPGQRQRPAPQAALALAERLLRRSRPGPLAPPAAAACAGAACL